MRTALVSDVFIRTTFSFALVLLIVAAVHVYLALRTTTHLLIIHFSPERGIDILGSRGDVYGILAVGASIFVIHALLSTSFYYRSRGTSYLIAVFSLAFNALLLTAVSVIVAVN
ncbi:MAG: hypothetical protein HY536_02240 [Candidatus Colwellbacteria bacterium]|nr:hypothetical protein [Candidatus Colwellbacteria bacterium]